MFRNNSKLDINMQNTPSMLLYKLNASVIFVKSGKNVSKEK